MARLSMQFLIQRQVFVVFDSPGDVFDKLVTSLSFANGPSGIEISFQLEDRAWKPPAGEVDLWLPGQSVRVPATLVVEQDLFGDPLFRVKVR